MKISKANAATLGHILADTLHDCDNLAERKGVLRVRDNILLMLRPPSYPTDDTSFANEYAWSLHDAFVNEFRDWLTYLEPDDYEPSVSPRDCAVGGEEDSNWT
jgi:hypothetical protein